MSDPQPSITNWLHDSSIPKTEDELTAAAGTTNRAFFLAHGLKTLPNSWPIEDEATCGICRMELNTANQRLNQLRCDHIFCHGCIHQWLSEEARNSCPICRCKMFELMPGEVLPPPDYTLELNSDDEGLDGYTEDNSDQSDDEDETNDARNEERLPWPPYQGLWNNRTTLIVRNAAILPPQCGFFYDLADFTNNSPCSVLLPQAVHFIIRPSKVTGSRGVHVDIRYLKLRIIAMANALAINAWAHDRRYSRVSGRHWTKIVDAIWRLLVTIDGEDTVAGDLYDLILNVLMQHNGMLPGRVRRSEFINGRTNAERQSMADDFECLLGYIVILCRGRWVDAPGGRAEVAITRMRASGGRI